MRLLLSAETLARRAPPSPNAAPNGAPDPLVALPPIGDTTGDALLVAAQQMLRNRKSIAAQVRLQVQMFDASLVGAGVYLQRGIGNDLRFRWDLRIQVDGQTSTLLQVADGRFLWTDLILPSGQTVTRVDLRRLAAKRFVPGRRMDAPSHGTVPGASPQLGSLFRAGGIARLLGSLRDHYVFDSPRQGELFGVPVLVITGVAARRAPAPNVGPPPQTSESPSGETTEPPSADAGRPTTSIPRRVQIVVGRDDFFPYRLEYFIEAGERTAADGKDAPALRVEWHNVQLDGAIDGSRFNYAPTAEANWRDITDEVVAGSE